MVIVAEVHDHKADLCREILDDLPQWFGIPEAKADYVAAVSQYPMLAACIDGEAVAFVSLKHHTDFAVELFVLGVKRRLHRQSVGRALIAAATDFARRAGFSFLTVKTLASTHPDLHYAATRRFYEAMGFLPIEVFPTLWDAHNPCLFMIKPIAGVGPEGVGQFDAHTNT